MNKIQRGSKQSRFRVSENCMLGELLLEFLRASRVAFLRDRATFPYLPTVTLFRCCAIDRRSASMSFPRDAAPRHLRTRHRKRFLTRGETASSCSSNPLDVRSISRCSEHTRRLEFSYDCSGLRD